MADIQQQSGPRLGFIGIGAMGSRMAGRLLDANFDLTIYNRTRERTVPLARRGAKVAASPKDLAAGVDVVLSSVTDDAVLNDVMLGPGEALAAARPGTTFIDMSTVSPRTIKNLYDAAERKGVSVLDAPVSGSTPVAEKGQLLIFAGGKEEVYTACKPIFAVLGKESFYMGPSGSGAAMKLCVNTLLGLGVQALAESIALGRKSGLDLERILNVLGETTVLSPAQKTKLDNARKDEYPATFALRLMFKDFRLILREAMDLSVPMPATAAAAQVCAAENARQQVRHADEDFSVVIRLLQQMAGESEEPVVLSR